MVIFASAAPLPEICALTSDAVLLARADGEAHPRKQACGVKNESVTRHLDLESFPPIASQKLLMRRGQ
jgi:hypothetical protein